MQQQQQLMPLLLRHPPRKLPLRKILPKMPLPKMPQLRMPLPRRLPLLMHLQQTRLSQSRSQQRQHQTTVLLTTL